jgi:hypothetical protein
MLVKNEKHTILALDRGRLASINDHFISLQLYGWSENKMKWFHYGTHLFVRAHFVHNLGSRSLVRAANPV